MESNIILAGVGGQGILSISYVIDMAALKKGWSFKQAEVHGMSQRGGEVQSHLRISDGVLHSDLVPKGAATLVLSVEPLESLRYVDYLSPQGAVVTGVDPFVNIDNYPPVEKILDAITSLPQHTLVAADKLAREAGSGKAQNMVLLGAASPFIGLDEALLEGSILEAFAKKGERVQKTNIDAFRAGKAAGEAYRACVKAGIPPRGARALMGRVAHGRLDADAIPAWKALLTGPMASDVAGALAGTAPGRISGARALPEAIQAQGQTAKLNDLLFPPKA